MLSLQASSTAWAVARRPARTLCAARTPNSRSIRSRAYLASRPGEATVQPVETPALSLLDAAMSAVLRLFDDEQPESSSEELQLPPELKAYLDEMEAHGASHGGGWVHSHIAERLASTDSASDA